jgi:hypothetical protein
MNREYTSDYEMANMDVAIGGLPQGGRVNENMENEQVRQTYDTSPLSDHSLQNERHMVWVARLQWLRNSITIGHEIFMCSIVF